MKHIKQWSNELLIKRLNEFEKQLLKCKEHIIYRAWRQSGFNSVESVERNINECKEEMRLRNLKL